MLAYIGTQLQICIIKSDTKVQILTVEDYYSMFEPFQSSFNTSLPDQNGIGFNVAFNIFDEQTLKPYTNISSLGEFQVVQEYWFFKSSEALN